MALIELNKLFDEIRGKMGNLVFRRRPDGKQCRRELEQDREDVGHRDAALHQIDTVAQQQHGGDRLQSAVGARQNPRDQLPSEIRPVADGSKAD